MGLLKVVVQYGLVRVLWHGNVERCVMWNEVPRVWADTARYMVVEVVCEMSQVVGCTDV